VVAVTVAQIFIGIQDLRAAHQGVDLLLQLLLGFGYLLVAHGFVLGGIGLRLDAIQCHVAQAHHAGLLAQLQDLNEQTAQSIKVATAEFTVAAGFCEPVAAVVRLLVTGQHPESQVLVASQPNPLGGDDAHVLGIDQQLCQPHHGRLCLHLRLNPLS
jgi:hypothetical protein